VGFESVGWQPGAKTAQSMPGMASLNMKGQRGHWMRNNSFYQYFDIFLDLLHIIH
jgi:hypothetical protein